MKGTTRRTVLRGAAGALGWALAGCLGSSNDDRGSPTTDGSTETVTGTPTGSPTPTATPAPTPVPSWALDSDVVVRFDDSPNLPGNGVEIHVREVGTPDAVKVYVSDDEGHTRWALLPEDDTSYSLYRDEYGVMLESYSAHAGIETGGDTMVERGVGWAEGTSPERTIEVYCVFDGEELLLERERGTV